MSIDNVQDITPRVQYVASAAQTVFDYPFPIFEDGDLVVIVDDVTKTLTTHYAVTGETADAGGEVTFVTPMTGGEIVTIYRDIAIQRTSDFQPNGPYDSDAMNDELDRMTMVDQQLENRINRALRIPIDAAVDDADIELDPDNYANMYLSFDANGKPVPTALSSSAVTIASIAQVLNSDVAESQEELAVVFGKGRTAAEIAAGVTPVNYEYEPGNILRYGTNTTPGTTDTRQAFINACASNMFVYVPTGVYYLSGSFTPQSNSMVYSHGWGADLLIANGDTTGIDLTDKDGVKILNLKLRNNGSTGTLGGVNGKGAIYLYNSDNCTIDGCYITNIYNVGIRGYDSNGNTIKNNVFGDWYTTGTANDDSANISMLGQCSGNTIEGNFCWGANAGTGIAVHEYYISGKQPKKNRVIGNDVYNKKAYGILVYTTQAANPTGFDCLTVVSGNTVDTVSGSYVSGASGAGIYLQGAGGAICTGNTVTNCCIDTSNFGTLAMSHITVSITNEANTAQILVSNNHILCARGPAIWAASSTTHSLKITNNTIKHTQASGAESNAIVCSASDFADISGNIIKQVVGTGIYMWTTGTGAGFNKKNSIIGNTIETGGTGIIVTKIATGYFKNVIVSHNNVTAGDIGISVSDVNGLTMSGNDAVATLYPIFLSACLRSKGSTNSFEATNTGTGLHIFGGVCTGSFFDATNSFVGAAMQNAATGLIIEQYGTAAPGTGTWAVGDRTINSVPTAGQPKAWSCTAAGSPGTHTSEGNL